MKALIDCLINAFVCLLTGANQKARGVESGAGFDNPAFESHPGINPFIEFHSSDHWGSIHCQHGHETVTIT